MWSICALVCVYEIKCYGLLKRESIVTMGYRRKVYHASSNNLKEEWVVEVGRGGGLSGLIPAPLVVRGGGGEGLGSLYLFPHIH